MATAQSYTANLPDVKVDVNPNMTDREFGSGSSLWAKFADFFGGVDSKGMYQNALTENNRAYEQALLRESRAYDEYLRNYNAQREDTQVQRMVKDIKAAGLNPWLALQSGGVSGSSAASQTAGTYNNVGTGSSAKHSSSNKEGLSSLAMLLVSTARLLAVM